MRGERSAVSNNMLPRTCRECGKTFQGGPRAWYCPECRAERKKIQSKEYKQRKKSGKTIPIGSLMKCEICGKEIVKSGGAQRFCPECAEKHLKEIDNQQSLEWKKANLEKVRESKRKISKERHATGESFESGVKGVTWDKGKRKWIVNINYRGKQYRIMQTSDKDTALKVKEESESFISACIKALQEYYASPSEDTVHKKEDNERYRNADMSKLTDKQRACLLDYLNGMRVQDIADKYGIKKPAVYNRIREAKRIIDTGSAYSPEELAKRKEYAQKYYQEHKERIKAQSVRYASAHPEEAKKARKRSYENNRDQRLGKMREYNKKYYQENRDRLLARNKARRPDNGEIPRS